MPPFTPLHTRPTCISECGAIITRMPFSANHPIRFCFSDFPLLVCQHFSACPSIPSLSPLPTDLAPSSKHYWVTTVLPPPDKEHSHSPAYLHCSCVVFSILSIHWPSIHVQPGAVKLVLCQSVVTGCTWVTCISDVREPISLHQAVHGTCISKIDNQHKADMPIPHPP